MYSSGFLGICNLILSQASDFFFGKFSDGFYLSKYNVLSWVEIDVCLLPNALLIRASSKGEGKSTVLPLWFWALVNSLFKVVLNRCFLSVTSKTYPVVLHLWLVSWINSFLTVLFPTSVSSLSFYLLRGRVHFFCWATLMVVFLAGLVWKGNLIGFINLLKC